MNVSIRRLAFVAIVAGTSASGVAAASSLPPANGHAQVIAQGLVDFDAGEYHWSWTDLPVEPECARDVRRCQEVQALEIATPTFLFGRSAVPVIMTTNVGSGVRIGIGEGLYVAPGTAIDLRAEDNHDVTTLTSMITAVEIATGPGEDGFVVGAGARDVDLVRDVLDVGERLDVVAPVSAMVLVTGGSVVVDDTPLTVGQSTVRAGEVSLINNGDGSAVVVIAIVGPAVGGETQTAPSPGSTMPTTGSTVVSTPPINTVAVPTPQPTPPPTTFDSQLDSDSDGLPDIVEGGNGTNPATIDTDGDGLTDGHEVTLHASNPNVRDSDGDGFDDNIEVAAGTEPSNPTSHP